MELIPIESCPLCGGKYLHPAYAVSVEKETETPEYLARLIYQTCQCGYTFLTRYLEDTWAYYENQYHSIVSGAPAVDKKVMDHEAERAIRLMPILNGIEPESCLDYGSSTGVLLHILKDKFNTRAMGVELSQAYRDFANAQGIETVEFAINAPGQYGLVTCIHVLEHHLNPMPILADLRSKSDLLLIEVPFYSFGFHHPVLYTYATFEMVLRRAGLTLVQKFESAQNLTVLCHAN